ncbi:hypothetical protein HKD37_15G043267 [Glycine soja]
MTCPLDESISCFLIKVDPWVLVPITFRGLYVIAIRGLHILAYRGLHALAFRGLRVLIFIPGPPLDIGGQPTVRAHPERETITHLLCILGQDFTRAVAKRRVRIMRTNMTTLTLLFSNILPSDHNANLPLQMYQLESCPQDTQWTRRSPTGPWGFQLWLRASVVLQDARSPRQGIAPARHPVDPKKSNRVLELSSSNCGSLRRAKHHSSLGIAGSRATDAPPSPLEFTSAHPQKG